MTDRPPPLYTPGEAIEAIRARLKGEWDNEQLEKLGPLLTNIEKDIDRIVRSTKEE